MTLPRVLSLSDTRSLLIDPPKEIEALRGACTEIGNFEVRGTLQLDISSGDAMEIEVEMEVPEGTSVRLLVLCSEDQSERTVIGFDAESNELFIDVSCSTNDQSVKYPSLCWNPVSSWYKTENDPGSSIQRAPLVLAEAEPLKLRVFVDRSIVEAFANSRQCITHRVYPTKRDSTGVAIEALGSTVRITRLTAWSMNASNPW